jgi:hypothetical protein
MKPSSGLSFVLVAVTGGLLSAGCGDGYIDSDPVGPPGGPSHVAEPGRGFTEATGAVSPVARPVPEDPDISIHQGPSAAGGDILIYDIKNGFVYDGEASHGILLLNVDRFGIRDAADEVVFCRFSDNELLDAQTGEVVYRLSLAAGFAAVYGGRQPTSRGCGRVIAPGVRQPYSRATYRSHS